MQMIILFLILISCSRQSSILLTVCDASANNLTDRTTIKSKRRSRTKAGYGKAARYSNNFFKVTGEKKRKRKVSATLHPLLYAMSMSMSMSISMMTIRNGCYCLAVGRQQQQQQHRQWRRHSGIIIPRMMTAFPRQTVVTKSMMMRSLSQLPSSSSSSSSSIAAAAASASAALQSKEITKIHHDDGSGGTYGEDSSSSSSSFFLYFGSLIQRIAYSMGIVYVVTEYGIEWTVCEGPSMMPTIKSRGEVILIDRFTPKLFGLNGSAGSGGGDTILERKSFALQCQKEHINKLKQQEKEKNEQFKQKRTIEQQQYNNRHNNNHNTQYQKQQQEEEKKELIQLIVHSNSNTSLEEVESVSIPSKNKCNSDGIIRHRSTKHDDENANVEKLKRVVFDDDDEEEKDEEIEIEIEIEETWFETRIPVNTLPSNDTWNRFWNQITTGISVGDVVVLQHPDRIGTVCKRVMGLPGDIVTKPSSQLGADRLELLLNGSGSGGGGGKIIGNSNNNNNNNQDQQQRRRMKRKIKRRILSSGIEVPDGHIWVEGDNPWNSSDSRNYGAVPASLIMGRVLCRLWPLRGNAMMERGDRPIHDDGSDDDHHHRASLTFSGSIIFPVGWDDQRIIREYVESTPKMTATTTTTQQQQQQQQK
jgi:signal peptidase I